MPRININEKDRTSPGTPGGYSNNTVLIAGFSAYTDEEIKANAAAIQADDNGIFEFESADDFEKTIGLVAPTEYVTNGDALEAKLPAHYGNQMAYELLKMGYPIIYVNLGAPYRSTDAEGNELSAADLMKKLGQFEDTWEIFKDKASYDFRFVSHGLLTSAEFAKSEDLVKLEKRVAKMREFLPVFNTETDRQETDVVNTETGEKVLETDLEATRRIYTDAVTKENKYLANKNTKAERESIGYTENVIKLKSATTEETQGEDVATGYGYGYVQANVNIAALEEQITVAMSVAEADNFTPADFAAANAAIAKLAHYKAVTASDGTEDEMDVTSGRGDCIALIEVDESMYISGEGRPESRIINAVRAMSDINADNGKYCACTVPSVVYNMAADERFGGNRKFPGAFHYLACFDNSLGLGFAEWYAAAGYTRGVSSYTVDHTSVKLGEIAVQALEPRNIKDQETQPKFAVNVIANFRGNYYLWGNRTCHPLGDAAGGNDLVASHFLNIRQLCTTIKKQLYVSCRRFTFDPNSDVLWINFKNSITPMLDRMKADQGVRDYKIEKVYTDKKATLKARIRIVPIEAVEDFLLEVSLEDSLGETAVTIAE
jgi:hypothetical protein